MKRLRVVKQEEEEEPYIVFPIDIITHIATFVSPRDLQTWIALLSVERRAVVYLRHRVGKYVMNVLSCLHGYVYTASSTPLPYGRFNSEASDAWSACYATAKSIQCWVQSMAVKGCITTPVANKQQQESLQECIVRFMRFCLVDETYQVTRCWVRVFSFMRLCQLHEEYFYKMGSFERRDINPIVLSTTTVDLVMHYDAGQQKMIRLIDWPGLKTIHVCVSKPGQSLKNRAMQKAKEKYAVKNPTKYQLLELAFKSATCALQWTLIYKLLRESLKLRAVLPTDPINSLVIQPNNKKKAASHHIYAREHGDILSSCFAYDGTPVEATVARRLRYDMAAHCHTIEQRFFIAENQVMTPTKPDRITQRVERIFARSSTTAVDTILKK